MCIRDRNSGDWNKCSFSNGCFNTVSPKIYLFNKPSEWTYQDWLNSEARYLLNQIPGDVLEYIYFSDMTDEEKAVSYTHLQFEFFYIFVGVNPFPCPLRFMPHNSINTHLVCPSRIKAASECVAALMRGVLHFQLPHDFSP